MNKLYQTRKPISYKDNPFGLVYPNAITKNDRKHVNIHPISYQNNDNTIAANIYTPPYFSKDKRYPAIVIVTPSGAVKEQAAGAYGQKLAEKGFITMVADASFQGESSGYPRHQEIPYYRIEDIKTMIDILSVDPHVDQDAIMALGLSSGGCYTLSAAQKDKRIQGIITISLLNMGSLMREGFQNSQTDSIHQRFQDISQLRMKELQTHALFYIPYFNQDHSQANNLYQECHDYYTKYAHPNAYFQFLQRNLSDLMAYDPIQFMYLIEQPLLMITSDQDQSKYMSEDAYHLAIETSYKELYSLKDLKHIQTYDPNDEIIEKIYTFYLKHIRSKNENISH